MLTKYVTCQTDDGNHQKKKAGSFKIYFITVPLKAVKSEFPLNKGSNANSKGIGF